MEENKKVVFSAIQPTGSLTIGNYIGAIQNMLKLQDEYDCFYAVADLHAITKNISPSSLRENSLKLFALFIAFGFDAQKNTVYVQSQVKEHSQLAWILNCFTMMGEAKRMVQFKEKSAQDAKNVNVGLFSYPILQASDILLYQTDLVPIGVDQKQHLELAKVIASRFNNKYSPTFKIPEGLYQKTGAKIYSLLEPESKMGKSAVNEDGSVFVLDDKDTIMRKFKRAVTDSGNEIKFRSDKKGISNLLTIHSAFSGKSIKQLEREYEGSSYAVFKQDTGEVVAQKLTKIQVEYKRIVSDKSYLADLMKRGSEKASYTAFKTYRKVTKKIGFLDL